MTPEEKEKKRQDGQRRLGEIDRWLRKDWRNFGIVFFIFLILFLLLMLFLSHQQPKNQPQTAPIRTSSIIGRPFLFAQYRYCSARNAY